MSNELALLDKATQMLAEAKTLDGVRHILNITNQNIYRKDLCNEL